MNRLNILKAQLFGARVLTDGGHVAFQSVLNRAYGYASPPSLEDRPEFTPETAAKLDPAARWFVDDPVSLAVAPAMLAMPTLDHVTHQILNDARLSPAGRAEKLKEPRTSAVKTIATAAAAVAANGATLDARHAKLYQPEAVDAQTELRHREARDDWRDMSPSRRTTALNAIRDGKSADLLAALKRAPSTMLQDHEASIVESAWRADVARRNPKAAAEMQTARANQEWAHSVVTAAAQYASRALTPAEIADGARGTGGEHLFNAHLFVAAADHAA